MKDALLLFYNLLLFNLIFINCNQPIKNFNETYSKDNLNCDTVVLIDSLAREILNNKKVYVFHANDTSQFLYVNCNNNIFEKDKPLTAVFYGNNVISINTDKMDTLRLNSVHFKSVEISNNSDKINFYVDYYIQESLKKSLEFYYSIDNTNCTVKLENLSVMVY